MFTLLNCSDGLKGAGKTMSLCHVVHFCYIQGWLVLHIPDGETKHWNVKLPAHNSHWWSVVSVYPPTSSASYLCMRVFLFTTAHIWVKNCKELLPSSYNTARFDQPLQATEWLRNFRITNKNFLSQVLIYGVKCSWCSASAVIFRFPHSEMNKGIILLNTISLADKDNTTLCVDEERVHWVGKYARRAGGSGEFSHSAP